MPTDLQESLDYCRERILAARSETELSKWGRRLWRLGLDTTFFFPAGDRAAVQSGSPAPGYDFNDVI